MRRHHKTRVLCRHLLVDVTQRGWDLDALAHAECKTLEVSADSREPRTWAWLSSLVVSAYSMSTAYMVWILACCQLGSTAPQLTNNNHPHVLERTEARPRVDIVLCRSAATIGVHTRGEHLGLGLLLLRELLLDL